MQSNKSGSSKGALWTGRVISTIMILFLIFDGVSKVMQESQIIQALAKAGYPPNVAVPLGLTVLLCALLYAIPRTSILGAVLLTGWLGGAVDSMVRMASPAYLYLFPIIFGILVWLGLYLRDDRLRELLPLRKN